MVNQAFELVFCVATTPAISSNLLPSTNNTPDSYHGTNIYFMLLLSGKTVANILLLCTWALQYDARLIWPWLACHWLLQLLCQVGVTFITPQNHCRPTHYKTPTGLYSGQFLSRYSVRTRFDTRAWDVKVHWVSTGGLLIAILWDNNQKKLYLFNRNNAALKGL